MGRQVLFAGSRVAHAAKRPHEPTQKFRDPEAFFRPEPAQPLAPILVLRSGGEAPLAILKRPGIRGIHDLKPSIPDARSATFVRRDKQS